MIEDKEMREIFRIESAEHIQRLEKGFLHLETDSQNSVVLEEVFREAHSLKGAARMVGQTWVEKISNRIEDILSAAKKGSAPLSSEVIDHLYNALDAIQSLVKEAVLGEKSDVIISDVLGQLKANPDSCPPSSTEQDKELRRSWIKGDTSARVNSESELSARKPDVPELSYGDFRIDTIRVETSRLDKLMALTGELNVSKLRISQRVEDIKDILILGENIYRNSVEYGLRHSESKKEDSSFHVLHSAIEKLDALINTFKNAIYEDSSRLDFVSVELEDSISRIRLLPLSTIFILFQRMVRDLAKDTGKEIKLVIEGGDTTADKRIIEEMKDPLMHMVRNAVDHGIETPDERERKNKSRKGTITLRAYQTPSNVVIEVTDDGQGLDIEAIKKAVIKRKIASENEFAAMSHSQICSLIFVSGISSSTFVSDVSGRGVGLDVVRANVERLKGTILIDSTPGMGCIIRISLPLTLATARVMLVTVNSMRYAVPVEHIQTTCLVNRKNIFTIEGRKTIVFDKMPVPVADLYDLLELSESNALAPDSAFHTPDSIKLPCIILSIGEDKVGIFVDELLDEQEIVIKPSGGILKRTRNISGSTILGTGDVCMVLNPYDLIKSAKKKKTFVTAEKPGEEAESRKSILVAEDSITVRTQMKRILEGAGYTVVVAVDGLDAYNKLGGHSFDALVSDVMMPNMDGLTLTEKIRQNKKYREIPVVLVTSLASDEDKKRGLEAGANAYITKPSFDQKVLLETLMRLI